MRYSLFLVLVIFLFSCVSPKRKIQSNQTAAIPGAPAIVYKTRANYFNNVPILLSADKQTIVAYPDPKDLTIDNKLCLPTQLENGYLLDNRGISQDVGFLNISYLDFSKLTSPPSLPELKKLLLDSDPLIEIYDLGLRSNFKNIEVEINRIISKNQLSNFKRLK